MFSFNTVFIGGNVVRDPELKRTGNDNAVTTLSIASNRKVQDREEVLFVDVVCWGKTAEIVCEYAQKGSPVTVEGRLTQNSWTDNKTGEARSKIVITANIVKVESRGDRSQPRDNTPQESYAQPQGDAPF